MVPPWTLPEKLAMSGVISTVMLSSWADQFIACSISGFHFSLRMGGGFEPDDHLPHIGRGGRTGFHHTRQQGPGLRLGALPERLFGGRRQRRQVFGADRARHA